jgi:hypothetical protein
MTKIKRAGEGEDGRVRGRGRREEKMKECQL